MVEECIPFTFALCIGTVHRVPFNSFADPNALRIGRWLCRKTGVVFFDASPLPQLSSPHDGLGTDPRTAPSLPPPVRTRLKEATGALGLTTTLSNGKR